ncbi:TIGR01244 family sulfur transferase [Altererythrobacter sp.]|uniref:TIGR01244 family sulfur transferase n=1 Tax=Altererythrobacter sp. TaxID=1872480 RepID=UPI003D12E189
MADDIFRTLSDSVLASPQIQVEDVARARDQGVTLIVNNRPDGESPDDPQGPEIKSAATAAGLDYVAIPVTHSGFSMPQVDAMADALSGAQGKVLAYCRSGTRSTLLWAMARAKQGESPDAIAEAAAAAGYDVTPVRATMNALAAQAND